MDNGKVNRIHRTGSADDPRMSVLQAELTYCGFFQPCLLEGY